MPGAVRLKLDRAIADHLRDHRSRHYDLLRDDPTFAPWLGTHLGERGKKRLDRVIREFRLRQKRKLTGRAVQPAREAPCAIETVSRNPLEHPADSPAERFAGAGSPIISHDELQGAMRRRRWQLEAHMEACLDEDGGLDQPDLYLKLSREHRALVNDSANMAKRFSIDLNSKAVMERVVAGALQDRAGDREGSQAIVSNINNIMRRTRGIAATGEGE